MAENNKPKPGTVYPAEPRKRLPGYLHDLLSATKIDYELVAAQCARGYDYKLETHNDAEIYVEDIVPDIATYNAQWPDDPEIKRSEEERKKREKKEPIPEMIDLGLPSHNLWCKYNVGVDFVKIESETPETPVTAADYYGTYIAYGETEQKSDYSWTTYEYANGAYNKLTKYCPTGKTTYWAGEGSPDNLSVLDTSDDIATVLYGNEYCMPTLEDLQELINNTTVSKVPNYNGITGLKGFLFTSNSNGNKLFIPTTGGYNGTSLSGNNYCYIRTSSLDTSSPDKSYRMQIEYSSSGSISINTTSGNRFLGQPTRMIKKQNNAVSL